MSTDTVKTPNVPQPASGHFEHQPVLHRNLSPETEVTVSLLHPQPAVTMRHGKYFILMGRREELFWIQPLFRAHAGRAAPGQHPAQVLNNILLEKKVFCLFGCTRL